MNGVAVAIDSGHGNVVSAKYGAFDAGDGSKIVAVHEVNEIGKERGVVKTSPAIDDPKKRVRSVICQKSSGKSDKKSPVSNARRVGKSWVVFENVAGFTASVTNSIVAITVDVAIIRGAITIGRTVATTDYGDDSVRPLVRYCEKQRRSKQEHEQIG